MFCQFSEIFFNKEEVLLFCLNIAINEKNPERLFEILRDNKNHNILENTDQLQRILKGTDEKYKVGFDQLQRKIGFQSETKSLVKLIKFNQGMKTEELEKLILFFKEFESARQAKDIKRINHSPYAENP